MKKIISAILLIISSMSLFAASRPRDPFDKGYRDPLIRPSDIKQLEDRSCELYISTNVSDAEVYINGFYEGRSNLTVTGLRPGRYRIHVKKNGYEDRRFEIDLRSGYRQSYSIELQKIMGKIHLHNVPDSALVYIDNEKYSGSVLFVEPGTHWVEIKRFGYNTYSETVHVYGYDRVDVYPEFSEAAFEVSNLKVSKDTINPEYSNVFGKTDIEFYVTSNGSATVEIFNEENEKVWFCTWNSFYTWNQSVTWNGRNLEGEALPTGVYRIKLSDGNYYLETFVQINRGAAFSLNGINTKGSGIGSTPAVFPNNMSLIIPYMDVSHSLSAYDSGHSSFFDVNLGLLCQFAKHCEFNLAIGFLPNGGIEKNQQVRFATSFKGYGSVPVGQNGSFCYGGLIHWAFVAEPMPVVYGIDKGNGLGFAAMFGFDFPFLYMGLSSDYIFAAETGSSFYDGSIWKNSISVAVKPNRFINIDGWFGINSSINNPELQNCTDMIYGFNYGAQLVFLLGNTSCMGNIKFECATRRKGKGYINCGIGLSYLL